MGSRQKTVYFGLLTTLAAILILCDVSAGAVWISPIQWLFRVGELPEIQSNILWSLRIPKTLTGIVAGVALATSGLLMQVLFNNPLAGPYVLGISSGASLGVALLTMGSSLLGFGVVYNRWSIITIAVLGSVITMLIVLFIARKVSDNVSLLIVGMMIGSLTSALVNVFQNFSNPDALKLFIIWSFGSLSNVGWQELMILVPLCVVSLLLLIPLLKPLNGLMLGEKNALSIGVDSRRLRLYIVLLTSILTGGVTAFCGPIAFVGIAVPHLARSLFRTADAFVVLPAAALIGSIILLACDTFNATLTYPLPISTLCAIVGAPIIIHIILRNRT